MTKHNCCGEPYLDFLPTVGDLCNYDINTIIGWNILPTYRESWVKVERNKWQTTSTRGIISYADTEKVWNNLRCQFDKYIGNLERLLIQID